LLEALRRYSDRLHVFARQDVFPGTIQAAAFRYMENLVFQASRSLSGKCSIQKGTAFHFTPDRPVMYRVYFALSRKPTSWINPGYASSVEGEVTDRQRAHMLSAHHPKLWFPSFYRVLLETSFTQTEKSLLIMFGQAC